MVEASAFMAPRRLVAARRKRGEGEDGGDGSVSQAPGLDGLHAFFTAQEYAQYSAVGGLAEERRYQQQQDSRQTLLTPGSEEVKADGEASGNKAERASERKSKHSMVLLEELLLQHFPDAGEQGAFATNSRRRLSALSIEQHEEYLALVRKRAEAHSRGLPEILALTAEEATQLQSLERQAREEQVAFFKAFRRATAPVRARNQSSIPPFAARWFEDVTLRNANEARRLYAQFFEEAIAIPIDSTKQAHGGQATSGDSTIRHVKEVLRIGSAAMIDARQLAPGMRVEELKGQGSSFTAQREAISADPHAEGLMLKYDCDVAVSSSTLLALFDATTSSAVSESACSWVIPVKSRVVVSNDGSPKKLLSLDRPLRSPNIPIRDKIALAGRSALMDQLMSSAGTTHEATGQTAYHVWEIGGKRVLVRTAIHGYIIEGEPSSPAPASPASGRTEADASTSDTAKRSVALSLFVKPDYRDLGLKEQLTASERCQLWLHSWLRGSSRVLVARLDPRTSVITEWEPHSLKTLIYGKSGEGQAQHADFFDPMTKFDVLARLVTCLCDLTGGDYLIRASPHAKDDRRLNILSSTTSPSDPDDCDNEDANVQVDLYRYLDKDSVSGVEMASIVEAVLPEWYRHDRIPYTFRTGTYCQEFFQDGVCSLLGNGLYCEGRHIQLEASKAAAANWCFEDVTEVLRRGKHVENRKRPPGRRAKLRPSFPFCAGGKLARAAVVANPHAPVKCRKQGCQLRHLTAHEIAERIADAAERAERGKRREYKKGPKTRGGQAFD